MSDPTETRAPENPWPARAAWLGRLAVGGIFVFAGGVKALDPSGFASQIHDYGWLPAEWTSWAALFFIATELFLGAGLILNVRPRWLASGTAALLVLFIAVSADAWARGSVVDCGCFGNLSERGPGEVVIEDLLMLGLLVPSFLTGWKRRATGWRLAAVAAIAVIGTGLALAAPHLPLDDLVTQLVPGAGLREMGLDALVPEEGAVLFALLDLESETSGESVAGLNEIAVSLPSVRVLGLAAATPEERTMFGWTRGAGFPVEEVGGTTLRTLARSLPRFALLVDGRVQAVWNESPPAPDEVRTALGGTPS